MTSIAALPLCKKVFFLRRTMAETDPKPLPKKREAKPRSGTLTSFKVNNIPWDLYDRISGKAGFLGLGRDQWIREVISIL